DPGQGVDATRRGSADVGRADAADRGRGPRQGRAGLSRNRSHVDLRRENEAVKSLAIAATGMNAQQTNIEVIANNIANINTTSFKRARAEFTDLFYQMDRMQGVPDTAGASPIPEGANMGLGVRSAAVRKLHIQGELTQTGNPLDVAINGRGWFQ